MHARNKCNLCTRSSSYREWLQQRFCKWAKLGELDRKWMQSAPQMCSSQFKSHSLRPVRPTKGTREGVNEGNLLNITEIKFAESLF